MPKCKPSRKHVICMFEIGQPFEAVTDVRIISSHLADCWQQLRRQRNLRAHLGGHPRARRPSLFRDSELRLRGAVLRFYEGQVKEASRRRNIAMDEEMRRYFALWRAQSRKIAAY